MFIATRIPPAGTGTPWSVHVRLMALHSPRQLTIAVLHVERVPWPQQMSWSLQQLSAQLGPVEAWVSGA